MKRMSFEALSAKSIKQKSLTLTHKGICAVNWDYSDSDFEFVFGENKVCRVWSVLAEFLSPKIARLRRCDISFDVYPLKDAEMFNAFESLVASLRTGEVLRVEKSNFVALVRLSQELENDELYSSLLGMIRRKCLHLDQAIFLLRVGIDLGDVFSHGFRKLRDSIARRFYKIDKQILDDLDLETTQFLLSSPSLKVEDEDSLCDFVCSRSESDLSFTSLFEFICFDYISNSITCFVSFVSDNLLQNINSSWRQICRRLSLETRTTKSLRSTMGRTVIYDEENPLDGIIAHLTRQCHGNVHDKGIVNVTASSCYKGALFHPKNVASLGDNSFHGSEITWDVNQWICYDFKERRVIPTSYSVMSYGYGPGKFHPKSWVIEVSNDGTENSWKEIDRRDNNEDLNDIHVIVNFKTSLINTSDLPSEGFRFFRFRQTGKNHAGNNIFNINSLEIFGTLFEV